MTSANSTDLLIFHQEYTQATFGAIPTSGTDKFDLLRFTSESLIPETETEISEEIESDNQIADSILTNLRASGSINIEWSVNTYNKLFIALLQASTAATPFPAVTAIATAATTVSITGQAVSHGTAFAAAPTANQWVYMSGWANAQNNGFFKVAAAPAPSTTSFTVLGSRLTNEGTGPSITITELGSITNGTTLTQFYIERHNNELAAGEKVTSFPGMVPSQFQLNVPTAGKITGSFNFVGKRETVQPAGTKGDGSPTAKTTTPIMSSISNVTHVLIDHVPLEVTQVGLDLNSNIAARQAVGILGAHSIRRGSIVPNGTVQLYLAERARVDAMVAQTPVHFAVCFFDGTNGYVIELMKAKFTRANTTTPGRNQDVFEDLAFTAFKHGTELKSVRIARL